MPNPRNASNNSQDPDAALFVEHLGEGPADNQEEELLPPLPPGGDVGLCDILQTIATQLVRQKEQIMHLMQRQRRGSYPNSLYEKFRKRGDIDFIGLEDPLQANEWLVHMENVYETMERVGRQKVALVPSKFRDIVDTWRKSVRPPYKTIADEDAWATMQRQFWKKFIPDSVTRRKKVEFHSLKQEPMTVGEYIHEFTHLSRFAPEFVDIEEKKADLFIEGLRPSI